MGDLITSAYGGPQITVDELLADPTYIPQRVVNDLTGAFPEDLFFRQAEDNKGVVAFREAAANYLADDAEEIAEFGEIPVSSPELGALNSAYAIKTGEAIRVSYEQRTENKVDAVTRAINALERTVVRHGINAAFAAFTSAGVPELQAGAAWTGGDPVKDLFDAIEMVQGAHEDGDENRTFDYDPNTLLVHPQALTKIVRNDEVQRLYLGNVAHENPVYKGLTDIKLFGVLNVATSRLMPVGEAYVFESGASGFKSDTIPLTMTPMYAEGGQSQLGGPNMSWRSDLVRKRAIGVDNPKAVVKITGI